MRNKISSFKIAAIFFLVLFAFGLTGCNTTVNRTQEPDTVIGIAWREQLDGISYKYLTQSLEALDIDYVLMDQVVHEDLCDNKGALKSEYVDANGYLTEEAASIVKNTKIDEINLEKNTSNISGVIFSGGSDISPTLYVQPQEWHGIEAEKDYNAARDVSDYLLMKYCLEKDLPVMGICRGMQLLAVVSGATIIQDIPTFFQEYGIEYDYSHRMDRANPSIEMDFAVHDVLILDEDSIIGKIVGKEMIENVPSWHHQAVLNVKNTPLKTTGISETCGKQMIEVIERTDKSYIVGYQFHMETAVAKNLNKADNAGAYMDILQAKKFFMDFAEHCS